MRYKSRYVSGHWCFFLQPNPPIGLSQSWWCGTLRSFAIRERCILSMFLIASWRFGKNSKHSGKKTCIESMRPSTRRKRPITDCRCRLLPLWRLPLRRYDRSGFIQNSLRQWAAVERSCGLDFHCWKCWIAAFCGLLAVAHFLGRRREPPFRKSETICETGAAVDRSKVGT